MTSVDSGVETGNDSNDSSITQHENLHNSTVPINNVTVMTNTNNNPLETGISTKRMFSLDESSLLCLPEDQSKVYRLPQYLRFPVIEKSDLQHNNENSASSSRSMKIATLPTAIQINASDVCNKKIVFNINTVNLTSNILLISYKKKKKINNYYLTLSITY